MKQLLADIFQAYHMDVYTYLYSLSRDASLSEDLTSEVFLDAVRSIGSFRGEADIRTWLYTIARRRWADHLRKRDREIPTESIHELYESSQPSTSDSHEAEELTVVIHRLLKTEPAQTRAIFNLRLEGYSYYEIAGKCGISENSARVIWFRTKAKLKKLLEKEGFSL